MSKIQQEDCVPLHQKCLDNRMQIVFFCSVSLMTPGLVISSSGNLCHEPNAEWRRWIDLDWTGPIVLRQLRAMNSSIYILKIDLHNPNVRRLKIKFVETGSVHRRCRSVIRSPLKTEVGLQNFVIKVPGRLSEDERVLFPPKPTHAFKENPFEIFELAVYSISWRWDSKWKKNYRTCPLRKGSTILMDNYHFLDYAWTTERNEWSYSEQNQQK